MLRHLPGWRWSINRIYITNTQRKHEHSSYLSTSYLLEYSGHRAVRGLIADGFTCLLFAAESIAHRLTPIRWSTKHRPLCMLRVLTVLPAHFGCEFHGPVHACFLGRACLEKPETTPSPQIRNGWSLYCVPSACFLRILLQVLKDLVQNTLSR